MLLPRIDDIESYRTVFRRVETWLPAMRVICDRHGLPAGELAPMMRGTHVTFSAGPTYVIKMFAPIFPRDYVCESSALKAFRGRLGIATPEPIAEGEIDGWPYLVMTHVDGVRIGDVWPDLDVGEQCRLSARLGEMVREMHAVPATGLPELTADWTAFTERQASGCADRHRRCGASEDWVSQIPAFLESARPLHPESFSPVLMSADLTDDHMLVCERDGRWEINALIDFGDAMVGFAEYEFAAPGVFLLSRPELRRAFLSAYGYAPETMDRRLTVRLFAWTLLHCFSNLSVLLRRHATTGVTSLDQLADQAWGLAPSAPPA